MERDLNRLSAAWIFLSILLLAPACAGPATPTDTTLCVLAAHPKDFEHRLVRIRVRVDGGDEYQDFLDEKCPSQKLIWTNDGPSANKQALDHLALAIHQVFLHNRPVSSRLPPSQYLTITATVVGFVDPKPFVNVYGFSPVDASDVSVHPAKQLEPAPPAVEKWANP